MKTARAENKDALSQAWANLLKCHEKAIEGSWPASRENTPRGTSVAETSWRATMHQLVHTGRWNIHQVEVLSTLIGLLLGLRKPAEPCKKSRKPRTSVRGLRPLQDPFLPFSPSPNSP